ncbi:MAG: hypothetical protein AB7G93_14210 [Bdellovibrionales bacterium]
MSVVATLVTILLTAQVFGDPLITDENKVRLRPARSLVIQCSQNQGQVSYTGSSDAIAVYRIQAHEVHYEVYRDGFFLASCVSVVVKSP